MTNNTNDFSKRTAATIKSLINKNSLFSHEFNVLNQGDNRHFRIQTAKPRALEAIAEKAGFIVIERDNKGVEIRCF